MIAYWFHEFDLMSGKSTLACVLMLTAAALGGCGIAVPQIKEVYDKDIPPPTADKEGLSGTAVLEFEIQSKIICELRHAVQAARRIRYQTGDSVQSLQDEKEGLLPLDWVAELSLSFQVDESGSLNPGVVLNTALPNALTGFGGASPASSFAQSFGLGLGGTLSSTATSVDKFDPYFTIAYLNRPILPGSLCDGNDPVLRRYGAPVVSSPLLLGNLGLKDWLLGSLYVNRTLRSVGKAADVVSIPAGFQPDVITKEIKFVVITSGNLTPTWKLVRVSANTGSIPFLGASRMRTHDLIITVGPPKGLTNQAHLASQIGNAVANANRASFSTQ